MRAKVEAALFTHPQYGRLLGLIDAPSYRKSCAPLAQPSPTTILGPPFLFIADRFCGNVTGTSAEFYAERSRTTFTPEEDRAMPAHRLRHRHGAAAATRQARGLWPRSATLLFRSMINWISHRDIGCDDCPPNFPKSRKEDGSGLRLSARLPRTSQADRA